MPATLYVAVLISDGPFDSLWSCIAVGAGSGGSVSGADQTGDGLGRLVDLLVGFGAADCVRPHNAVAHVLLEQSERD